MRDGPDPDENRRLRALRRTLEQRGPAESDSSVDGGLPWLSGLVGAAQALLFSLAVVLVPTIATVVASNAQVGATTSGWTAAVPVGTRIWLLGHGVPLAAGETSLTFVPLGVAALALCGAFISARRSVVPAWSSWVSVTLTYAVGVLLLALLSGSVDVAQLVAAVLGGAVVGLVGFGWGMLTRPDAGPFQRAVGVVVRRVHVLVRTGLRGGMVSAATVLACSGVLVLVWVVAGRTTILEGLGGLHLDAMSAFSLGVAQLALLPNLVVWGVAWLAGPGFAVGSGTHFGADLVVSRPLPAVPLLGALPEPTDDGGLLVWAPVLVVAAGAVGGWFIHRRLERMLWWHVFPLAVLVGLGAGGVMAALVALSSGVAGPGRLADVGAAGLFVGLCVAAQTAGGALLVLLLARPEVRVAVRAGWHRARGSAGGEETIAADAGVPSRESDSAAVSEAAPGGPTEQKRSAVPAGGAAPVAAPSAERAAAPVTTQRAAAQPPPPPPPEA